MNQVAQILRCSRKTVYRLISSGRLGAVRWGRSYRFRRQDVQEFVRGSMVSGHRAKSGITVAQNDRELFKRRLDGRSEEHTSELQSRLHLVCRLLLEKKNI